MCVCAEVARPALGSVLAGRSAMPRPYLAARKLTLGSKSNLPTKIVPAKIAWLKLSGKFPLGLGIPPLQIQIMLESNPLRSRILVRRLAVTPRGENFQSSDDQIIRKIRISGKAAYWPR